MGDLPAGSRQYRTYWLSFHASYRCRHSGACCSSGWDIPIEKARVSPIAEAIEHGRIAGPVRWLTSVDGAPDDVAGVLALNARRRCVFHRDGCAIHAALGHAAMPAACQHFPRVALIDPRGVFVTLSHYCPSAASLLLADDGLATIVEGPPALPDGALPEGLDAREALPPFRSPRELMDLESYAAWERETVHALAASSNPAEVVTSLLGREPALSDIDLFDIARAAVPAPYDWPEAAIAPDGDFPAHDARVVGRFLAAHAFACWMAYQGNGLRSTAMYLRVVLAVLRVEGARHDSLLEAIRQADLLLRHLVDREALAARISSLSA